MGTKENAAGIRKVQTYQILSTAINPDISIKTVRRESGKKYQRRTRTKIKRINASTENLTITKKMFSTRIKCGKRICKQCHRRRSLR